MVQSQFFCICTSSHSKHYLLKRLCFPRGFSCNFVKIHQTHIYVGGSTARYINCPLIYANTKMFNCCSFVVSPEIIQYVFSNSVVIFQNCVDTSKCFAFPYVLESDYDFCKISCQNFYLNCIEYVDQFGGRISLLILRLNTESSNL